MKLIAISGSNRTGSTNLTLLHSVKESIETIQFEYFNIEDLPTFHPDKDQSPISETVLQWRNIIGASNGLLVFSPEYLHNIPAILKNALEWLSSSGELSEKPVIPIVFTPHAPRGEKALESLTWTLQALNSRVICSLHLHHNHFEKREGHSNYKGEGIELIEEAISFI